MPVERLAGLRWPYALGTAMHQRHAEFVLERGKLLAQGRLCNAHDLGRARQAALVDDRHEIAHGADVHGFLPMLRVLILLMVPSAIPISHAAGARVD